MNEAFSKISNIPTNIITGFLGVGKTTAILQLLKSKPADERWAVLVNEFGEIGIDGHLFEGQYSENEGVYIRQVPGGCMCCAAGVPMQVALNQLLKQAKPDRLLIEPTGLGHPVEVLQTLYSDIYRDVLSVEKTVTLLDARNLTDKRYTSHDTFNQQLEIADIIIANKSDLYSSGDEERLKTYLKDKGLERLDVISAEYGVFDLHYLQGRVHADNKALKHHHHHAADDWQPVDQVPLPECGYISAANQGEAYCSIGWRFSSAMSFDYNRLWLFLNSLNVERMKAVFITSKGMLAFNMAESVLTELSAVSISESRIDIIAKQINEHWEKDLLACRVLES